MTDLSAHIIAAKALADAYASESSVCRYPEAARMAAMLSIAHNKAALYMEAEAARQAQVRRNRIHRLLDGRRLPVEEKPELDETWFEGAHAYQGDELVRRGEGPLPNFRPGEKL